MFQSPAIQSSGPQLNKTDRFLHQLHSWHVHMGHCSQCAYQQSTEQRSSTLVYSLPPSLPLALFPIPELMSNFHSNYEYWKQAGGPWVGHRRIHPPSTHPNSLHWIKSQPTRHLADAPFFADDWCVALESAPGSDLCHCCSVDMTVGGACIPTWLCACVCGTNPRCYPLHSLAIARTNDHYYSQRRTSVFPPPTPSL